MVNIERNLVCEMKTLQDVQLQLMNRAEYYVTLRVGALKIIVLWLKIHNACVRLRQTEISFYYILRHDHKFFYEGCYHTGRLDRTEWRIDHTSGLYLANYI